MSVDTRIRKGLTMIEKSLPTVDTVEGYQNLQREVRRGTWRRRALIGAAAAAVLVVSTCAVLLNWNGQNNAEPAKTMTFHSPLYGYSIALPNAWHVHAATKYADDPKSSDKTGTDWIHVPGTDTVIRMEALSLGRQTYAAWARSYHRAILADPGVPSGCDGGDPSQWRSFPIGSAEGHLLQKCNEALGIVPVGTRVYLFIWSNRTFVEGHHYPQSQFEPLLKGVTLPDAATASEPLYQPSSQGG
jgi:hypothetical protein